MCDKLAMLLVSAWIDLFWLIVARVWGILILLYTGCMQMKYILEKQIAECSSKSFITTWFVANFVIICRCIVATQSKYQLHACIVLKTNSYKRQ